MRLPGRPAAQAVEAPAKWQEPPHLSARNAGLERKNRVGATDGGPYEAGWLRRLGLVFLPTAPSADLTGRTQWRHMRRRRRISCCIFTGSRCGAASAPAAAAILGSWGGAVRCRTKRPTPWMVETLAFQTLRRADRPRVFRSVVSYLPNY